MLRINAISSRRSKHAVEISTLILFLAAWDADYVDIRHQVVYIYAAAEY